jgi:phosphatidylinositol-3-phosphatase
MKLHSNSRLAKYPKWAAPIILAVVIIGLSVTGQAQSQGNSSMSWASDLPVYDHVVIVVEENKNYEQIIGNNSAPYINELGKQSAVLTRMFAEEHFSEGNYFWLFSGSNQGVGYVDVIPPATMTTENLGHALFLTQRSFAGYSEGLPTISSQVGLAGRYARKHVPWVSFANLPRGNSADKSSNLRYPHDFPKDFKELPTVAFVIPDLIDDMHDGGLPSSIHAGDGWLKEHLDAYYQWAKQNNSLLIVTFDEDDRALGGGPTDPASPNPRMQNHIATIFAGAHIRPGKYDEGKGVNHVTLLRTLEAMYGLSRSGSQQDNAARAGISDDAIITDVFEKAGK